MQELRRFDFAHKSMGVEFRIVLFAGSAEKAQEASDSAFRRIDRLDRMLSHYKEDSEISRLVRQGGEGKQVPVSHELWYLLQWAQTYSEASGGAFDVTVGPLTELWRKARMLGRLPSDADLQAALQRVGYDKVSLGAGRDYYVILDRHDMALDLGGIAKGYAVDQALAVLRAQGIDRALVDGSGDIAVWDPPPDKAGWTIAVSPTGERETRYLSMCRGAIATSGDSYGRVVIDGKRYSHIVDPRTGMGLVDSAAVSVLAPDCRQADALATVVSVMGAAEGIEVLKGFPDTGVIIHRKESSDPAKETQELQYPKDLGQLPFVVPQDREPGATGAGAPEANVETSK